MSRQPDPFRDPADPFRDSARYGPDGQHAASAAGSQADLLNTVPMSDVPPPVSMTNPYARYDNPTNGKPPSWMQSNEKSGSKAGKIFRRTWIIVLLVIVLVAVCVAVPVALHFTKTSKSSSSNDALTPNKDGLYTNVPKMPDFPTLIDPDTPQAALTSKSLQDSSSDYTLVFSDEFNTEGRSFYPGDDPFWEGSSLHYWQTGDLEWYEPGQLTTKNGALEITLDHFDDISQNYNLSYRSGMMSTWNKFCFTGGRFEASVMLPGSANVLGLWPAVWSMGNLGRVGYGASLEGMWPYTYDSCDVGTLKNQTLNGLPVAATVNGDKHSGGVLSFLPGQRLSRCTCAGESHPGPKHSDGTFVGRSAPEIDMFEATVGNNEGIVSQSGQWAPFNAGYNWFNTSDNLIIYNSSTTTLNGYQGGVFQQAISSLSVTNQQCYERSTNPCFSTYGFEYKPGFDGAYITWMSQGVATWTMMSGGVKADTRVEIDTRPVPQEPMYLITNLGLSESFGGIDFKHLTFPTKMRVDWVRVYQPKNAINIGCDPADFPTADYINKYPGAYNNPNFTTWQDDFKQPFPKNKLIDQC